MVVQRRHLEQTSTFAIALFGVLEVSHLQHHGHGFGHKNAAHHGQHNFLAHDHGDGAQCCTQSQRTHIAHEHLRGVSVEPEKSQTSARHGTAEHQQFTRAGNRWEKQIFGVADVTRHIGKNAQHRTHHDHRHDGQTIKTVRQIHRIAGAHNHHIGEDDEAQHAQRIADFLEERHQQTGLGRQIHGEAGLHPGDEQREHFGVVVLGNAEHQVQRRQQTDHRLPEELLARAHAFGVFVDHFAPVVHPANRAKAQRHQQHDPDKAIRQLKPQQG